MAAAAELKGAVDCEGGLARLGVLGHELESGLRERMKSGPQGPLPLRSWVWPHTHMVDESRTARHKEHAGL